MRSECIESKVEWFPSPGAGVLIAGVTARPLLILPLAQTELMFIHAFLEIGNEGFRSEFGSLFYQVFFKSCSVGLTMERLSCRGIQKAGDVDEAYV